MTKKEDKKRFKVKMRNEFNKKGYSFMSSFHKMTDELSSSLIQKAHSVFFIQKLIEPEYGTIIIKNSQHKTIKYKFHKSVKNKATIKDKKGMPDVIKLPLGDLIGQYHNKRISKIDMNKNDIDVYVKFKQKTGLFIVFRIHADDMSSKFTYDLGNRYYRVFFNN